MTACLAAIDDATRDTVGARRNAAFGLWAGRRLGLSGEALASYVREVMEADLTEPGIDDIVGKVWCDLNNGGVPASQTEILVEMRRAERLVRAELHATD